MSKNHGEKSHSCLHGLAKIKNLGIGNDYVRALLGQCFIVSVLATNLTVLVKKTSQREVLLKKYFKSSN